MAIKYLDSEDVAKSRKEVDKVYDIFRAGLLFNSDPKEGLKKPSRRVQKNKVSSKSSSCL